MNLFCYVIYNGTKQLSFDYIFIGQVFPYVIKTWDLFTMNNKAIYKVWWINENSLDYNGVEHITACGWDY